MTLKDFFGAVTRTGHNLNDTLYAEDPEHPLLTKPVVGYSLVSVKGADAKLGVKIIFNTKDETKSA